MIDSEYYQDYKGPNLTNAILNEKEDITKLIQFFYGEDNNWEKKLSKNYYLSLLVKNKSLKKEITFSFLNFIYIKFKPNLFACSGFNKNIKKIYEKIGKIKKFSHFYIYNDKIKNGLSKNLQKIVIKDKKINNKIKIEETNFLKEIPYSKYYPSNSNTIHWNIF